MHVTLFGCRPRGEVRRLWDAPLCSSSFAGFNGSPYPHGGFDLPLLNAALVVRLRAISVLDHFLIGVFAK